MNNKFTYTTRLFDRAQACELSDDFTLPDYMPAIGRIISCNATAAAPTLYFGGGSAEYAGGIKYSVLYESADDSTLWCAELPSEYDLLLSDSGLPKDPSALSYLPEACAENVTARVTAPRKMTLKCRVRLSPELRSTSESETLIHGDGGNDDLKLLTARADAGHYSSVSNVPLVCKDILTRAEAGLSSSDEFRIISARGDAMISHIQLSDGDVVCRGEVCAHILLTREGEGERARKMIRKIPFTETLRLGSALPKNIQIVGVRSNCVCTSLAATAKEDSIDIEASVTLSAEIAGITEISYIKDAYSKSQSCETSKRKIRLLTPLACRNGNATVTASKPLADLALDSGMRLCDVRATLLPDLSAEVTDGGRLIASGKIKFSVIADNGAELIPAEFEADMKYIADICSPMPTHDLHTSLSASVCEVKGRIDTDRLACDCEIYVSCLIDKEEEISVISEINLTPATFSHPEASCIRVCYPAKNETLWDIAKKYHTEAERLAECNMLETTDSPDSPDSLKNAKFLII